MCLEVLTCGIKRLQPGMLTPGMLLCPFTAADPSGMSCSLLTRPNSGTQWSKGFTSSSSFPKCSSCHSLDFLNTSRVLWNAPRVSLLVSELPAVWTVQKAWNYHHWWRLAKAKKIAQHPQCCTQGSQPPSNKSQAYCRLKQNCFYKDQAWHLKQRDFFLYVLFWMGRDWISSYTRDDSALDYSSLLFWRS